RADAQRADDALPPEGDEAPPDPPLPAPAVGSPVDENGGEFFHSQLPAGAEDAGVDGVFEPPRRRLVWHLVHGQELGDHPDVPAASEKAALGGAGERAAQPALAFPVRPGRVELDDALSNGFVDDG